LESKLCQLKSLHCLIRHPFFLELLAAKKFNGALQQKCAHFII